MLNKYVFTVQDFTNHYNWMLRTVDDIIKDIFFSFFFLQIFQMQNQNIDMEGLDIAGDLDELKKNIAKLKKGKLGKGLLSDIEINDLDWYDQNRKVKAVTIFIYETSV